ncbi:unnamed protein product [Sympodiomycopsis kandeliae]
MDSYPMHDNPAHHGVKFEIGEASADGANTLNDGSHAAVRQPSFNDLPPTDKRATVVLESGLPEMLRPKDEQRSDPLYKEKLQKRLNIKNTIILFICEFTGTTLFLFFAYGIATQASDRMSADSSANPDGPPNTSALLFSSLGFGFSLAVMAWVFFRITGSLFNPALTLGLTLLGNLDWIQCIVLSISQYVGAIAAAGLVAGLLPGAPNMRTKLGSGTTVNQGFWIEFFSTCMLLFTVFMLAGEKHKGTFLAPVGIGLALFLGELLATKYTGGSLNPARSLGPDVVAKQFEHYAWIYWIAPYMSTLFTVLFYKGLVYFQYKTVVPDQDADEFGDQRQVIRDAYGNMIGALDIIPAEKFGFMTAPEVDLEAEAVSAPPTAMGSRVENHQVPYANRSGEKHAYRKDSQSTFYEDPYASSSRRGPGPRRY